MVKIDAYISNDAPNVRDGLWLKPVAGGVEAFALVNGSWMPLVAGSSTTEDIQNKADRAKDAKSGNLAALDSDGNPTDSGSKAADFALLGTKKDAPAKMTLYGLKAYIDSQVQALQEGE